MQPIHNEGLNEFGSLLISEVYDATIEFLQGSIDSPKRGIGRNEEHDLFQQLDENSKNIACTLMNLAMDQCFARFLYFVDRHRDKVHLTFDSTSQGTIDVAETSDGLPAEPYTDEGWIAWYSKHQSGVVVQ